MLGGISSSSLHNWQRHDAYAATDSINKLRVSGARNHGRKLQRLRLATSSSKELADGILRDVHHHHWHIDQE